MSVYKRTKVWYYRFKIKGTLYKKSIPTARTKEEAKQAETKARNDIHQGIYGKPVGNEIFIKFARNDFTKWAKDNWSSPIHAVSYVNSFEGFFKKKTFNQISAIQVEAYKQWLRKTPIKEPNRTEATIKKQQELGILKEPRFRSKATINCHLAVLSKIFKLAITNKKTTKNPVEEVERYPKGEGRKRFLLIDQNEGSDLFAELDNQPDHLKNFVLIAIHTGMRFSEIRKLHVDFIDWPRKEVILPDPKSKREERVPMNPFVCDLLRELETQNINGWFLPNPHTGLPYVDLKKGMAKLFASAGLDDFTYHALRHSFATELVDQTKDIAMAQKILRHKRTETTMGYVHIKENRKEEAVTKMGDFWKKVSNREPSGNVLDFKQALTG